MSSEDTPGRRSVLSRMRGPLAGRRESDEVRIARERREWWFPELQRAIEILGSGAAAQRQWLHEVFAGQPGVDVDELAIQLEDLWMDGDIVHAEGLGDDLSRALDSLDRALGEMSGAEHAELWTEDALDSRPEWERIRRLATRAAEALRRELDNDLSSDIGRR